MAQKSFKFGPKIQVHYDLIFHESDALVAFVNI